MPFKMLHNIFFKLLSHSLSFYLFPPSLSPYLSFLLTLTSYPFLLLFHFLKFLSFHLLSFSLSQFTLYNFSFCLCQFCLALSFNILEKKCNLKPKQQIDIFYDIKVNSSEILSRQKGLTEVKTKGFSRVLLILTHV